MRLCPPSVEFQSILENEKGYAKYKKLSELAADFVYAAQTYGQIIVRLRLFHFCFLSVAYQLM